MEGGPMSVEWYMLANGEIRWLYVFDRPRKPGQKRDQAKKRGFIDERTAREAEAQERNRVKKFEAKANGTLAAELGRWVERRKPDLARSAYSDYRYRFEAYVNPYIGDLPVYRASDPTVIAGLYTTLGESGARRGGGLKPVSVYGVHLSLTSALRDMGIDVSGIRAPKHPRTKGRKARRVARERVWSIEECLQFLRHTADDRMFAVWVLAMVTGMRRGELAGLRWRYIDLTKGMLYVRRQRVTCGWVDGGVYEDDPKRDSDRDIPLGPLLVEVLYRQLEFCRQERERLGARFEGEDFVFTSPRYGRPYFPGHITHRFSRLSAEAGLRHIRLHDLRHSSASIAGFLGVDLKALQERIGHADAETLTDIYMHELPTAARAASLTIEQAMIGGGL